MQIIRDLYAEKAPEVVSDEGLTKFILKRGALLSARDTVKSVL